MSIQATILHFDKRRNVFRDLAFGGIEIRRLKIDKRDTHYLRVAMFDANHFDKVKLDVDGSITAPTGNDLYTRPSISDRTTLIIGIKPRTYYETSDYETRFTGFVTDGDWDGQSAGAFTGSVLLGSTIAEGEDHVLEMELINTSGGRLTLPRLVLVVGQDVNTGAESTAPTGLPGGSSGDVSISGTNTSVATTVTGLTSTGHVNIQVTAATGTPGDVFPVVTYATNTFTITTSSAPGTGNAWNFRWTLIRTS